MVKLDDLIDTYQVPQDLKDKLLIYHLSVDQKLWSARFYLNFILSLDPKQAIPNIESLVQLKAGDLSSTISTTSSSSITKETLENLEYQVNLGFDGLVMNLKSALDSLAHEVNEAYSIGIKEKDIYFNDDFIIKVKNFHPTKKISPFLEDVLSEKWFQDLKIYRDITTHERLVETKLEIVSKKTIDPRRGTVEERIDEVKRYLPDDLENFPLEYSYLPDQQLDSVSFSLDKSVTEYIDKGYELIKQDIDEEKTLPISKRISNIL